MSDRIALMRSGRIEQVGTPDQIYHQPGTRYVADFIGETNLLGGKVVSLTDREATVELGSVLVRAPRPPGAALPVGAGAWLSVRPERITVGVRGEARPERNRLDGVVADVVFVGAGSKVHVALANGTHVVADRSGDTAFAPGDPVAVGWPVEAGVLLRD
jgi:ABC-type Fe3+/spermidine/putrescine transport system ATPase subunit